MLKATLKSHKADFDIDISLSCDSDVTAIFGPSGAGKTSILRILAGFERSTTGTTISFNDELWHSADKFIPTHQRGIGWVAQKPVLFEHLNVLQNLQFSAQRQFSNNGISLDDAIQLSRIEHLLTKRIWQLSGGEQQRIALARALVFHPQLLLLDEPLSNLDQDASRELLSVLTALKAAISIPTLYVSHSRDELYQFADKLVLIEQGKIIEQGDLAGLSTSCEARFNAPSGGVNIWSGTCSGIEEDGLSLATIEPNLQLWLRKPSNDTTKLRIGIPANALSISLSRPSDSSIINCMASTVTAIKHSGNSHCLVQLALGDRHQLHASITQRSMRLLDLKPGKQVYAQIKGVNLLSL